MKKPSNKLLWGLGCVLSLLAISLPSGVFARAEELRVKDERPQPVGKVDLDIKEVDIREVARIFSSVSGLNFVVGEDVQAKVTFKGAGVEWETALNMILKTYNLTYVREGSFLRILTYDKLRQEEDGVPLVTKVVFLNFAKASDLVSELDPVKSGRGRINMDLKTNSLIITDTPDKIPKILEIINELDRRTPQVMIEALMLDVKLTNEEQLGINWTIGSKARPDISMSQVLIAGRTEGIIRYGKTILPYANFTALIDFWCQSQKAEVLANPKVLTLDGLTSSIELVEQIPFTQSQVASQTGAITSSVSFKDAGIKLNVTPHISAEKFISLDIKTEQSFRTGTVSGQPIIDSRKAQTNLLVSDGETVVIGGLKKKNSTLTIDRLPILGSIPLLGKFFQKKVNTSTDSELLIFVTPYIIASDRQLTAREKESLDKFKQTKEKSEGVKLSKKNVFPLRAPAGAK